MGTLKQSIKSIIILFIASCVSSVLFSCKDSDSGFAEVLDYAVCYTKIITVIVGEEYPEAEAYKMNVIQVYGLADETLQQKINDSILFASLSWFGGEMLNSTSRYPTVCHLTSRYISIKNTYSFDSGRMNCTVEDYITIDLTTGERIFLNSIIDISDAFIMLLREPAIVQGSTDSQQFDGNPENLCKWLAEVPEEEIIRRLEECSKDQETVLADGEFPLDHSINSVLFRNTFYFEQDKLVLLFGERFMRVTLDMDVVKPFLLVNSW